MIEINVKIEGGKVTVSSVGVGTKGEMLLALATCLAVKEACRSAERLAEAGLSSVGLEKKVEEAGWG